MKIELCEDNGFLFNGKPTLVVLVVTHDDGRQHRIPYQASKRISELYADVRKLGIQKDINYVEAIVQNANIAPKQVAPKKDDKIGREDIVKVVKLERDLDGNVNEELEVGREYRIIDIHKKNGVVTYYEVLDDAKGDKLRIPVLPSEIELVKKFVRGAPRKVIPDIIKRCECGEDVALLMTTSGDAYQGQCDECGKVLIEHRKAVHV